MTRGEYDEYDYIVCMDNANLRNLRRMTDGDPDGKISLMLDHAGRSGPGSGGTHGTPATSRPPGGTSTKACPAC